jgi:hypothetical protein
MEITNFIDPIDIEAFEFFNENIEEAKNKTIKLTAERICNDLELYSFEDYNDNMNKISLELKKVKNILDKEVEKLLSEWFNLYIIN